MRLTDRMSFLKFLIIPINKYIVFDKMGGEAKEKKKLNEMVIIKIYTSEKCIVYSCNLHPGEDSHT